MNVRTFLAPAIIVATAVVGYTLGKSSSRHVNTEDFDNAELRVQVSALLAEKQTLEAENTILKRAFPNRGGFNPKPWQLSADQK